VAKKKNVIITGAAGLVGTILRQHWGDRYALRLTDIRPTEHHRSRRVYYRLPGHGRARSSGRRPQPKGRFLWITAQSQYHRWL